MRKLKQDRHEIVLENIHRALKLGFGIGVNKTSPRVLRWEFSRCLGKAWCSRGSAERNRRYPVENYGEHP
jgi:hypothetical protein